MKKELLNSPNTPPTNIKILQGPKIITMRLETKLKSQFYDLGTRLCLVEPVSEQLWKYILQYCSRNLAPVERNSIFETRHEIFGPMT
jgi:hypothetical protein